MGLRDAGLEGSNERAHSMYFKARMSNHPGKWGNYLALGRDEVCVLMCVWSRCVCISVETNRKMQAVFKRVCVSALECYLAYESATVCKW